MKKYKDMDTCSCSVKNNKRTCTKECHRLCKKLVEYSIGEYIQDNYW